MTDEELLAQATALVPVYCDGFGAFRKLNGVFRCIGWDLVSGANLNLVVTLAGAEQSNQAARMALDGKTTHSHQIWAGVKLAH